MGLVKTRRLAAMRKQQRAKALKPCKLWPKTLQDNEARLQDNSVRLLDNGVRLQDNEGRLLDNGARLHIAMTVTSFRQTRCANS